MGDDDDKGDSPDPEVVIPLLRVVDGALELVDTDNGDGWPCAWSLSDMCEENALAWEGVREESRDASGSVSANVPVSASRSESRNRVDEEGTVSVLVIGG